MSNLYNRIAKEGRKMLRDYKRKKQEIDKKDINYNMIEVNRFNVLFDNEDSMTMNVIFGEIEKKMNYVSIITLLLMLLLLFIGIFLANIFSIITYILIMILGLDLILLTYYIYFEIIFPDKIKEIYSNGYYMRGYIIDGNRMIEVNEFFLNSYELNKHRDEVINKYLANNRG